MNKVNLPDVSLIIVDCVEYERAKLAYDFCQSFMSFGDSKILTSLSIDSPEVVKIPHIDSIAKYSDFMIYEFYKYIDTKYVLSAQWDGFIIRPELWDDAYLDYDYIGAPWPGNILYQGVPKHFNVGNGGFSLRSKELMEFMATDKNLTYHYLEDVMICQLNRAYLEAVGFKFAPLELAMKFSWECGEYRPTFGVHQRLSLRRILGLDSLD